MKTYLKYAFLFLFVNTLCAQLTVRNSSYVYVTDEVVFVTDEVNLREANSMFYLRDEAQLIQGSGTTGNTGIGQLSVFQTGSADNYSYNYWCSPVGNTTADNSGNRAYTANNNMYDWIGSATPSLNTITSAPSGFTSGLDGTSSPLTISRRWLFSFSPGINYSDWDYIGDTGNLNSGYGFSMKGSLGANSQLYDFRGKPNAGDIPTAVLAGQFTLVGNPYPSALDAAAYIHDPANTGLMTGTLLFWEHDLNANSHNVADYIGGYATFTINAAGDMPSFIAARFDTYNADGTLNTTGSTSTSLKLVERYIPIGQGFMIEGTGNGTVFARDSHRAFVKESDSNSGILFRTGTANTNESQTNTSGFRYNDDGLFIVPDDYKRFRLNIDFDDDYTYQLMQNFHDTATEGFDYGLEIKQATDVSSEVYFKNPEEDNQLLTQANKFDRNLRIPLYFDLTAQKAIRVRLFDVQNFNDDQEIYLHDIVNDIYYNLRTINFEGNLDPDSSGSKYEITFRDFNSIEDDTETPLEIEDFTVLQNNNTSRLTILNPDNFTISEIAVYDVAGKQIMQKNNLNDNTRYEFPTNNFSEGTYVVKTTLAENNKVINKKIIIKNAN